LDSVCGCRRIALDIDLLLIVPFLRRDGIGSSGNEVLRAPGQERKRQNEKNHCQLSHEQPHILTFPP